jgi:hypothetical protein
MRCRHLGKSPLRVSECPGRTRAPVHARLQRPAYPLHSR